MVDPLSLAEAAEVLGALGDGLLPDPPDLLVVDADSAPAAPAGGLVLPVGSPTVLIAVSASPAPPGAPPGADLYLTCAPDPPSPWVTGEVEVAEAALREHPQAASTLTQVLRAGSRASPEVALTIESLAYATLQGGNEHRRWLAGREPRPADTGAAAPVAVERRGSVLVVTLDRPRRRNAFSSRVRDGLVEAFQLAAVDSSIVSVELRGNGPNFCSGGDLAEFGTVGDTATAHQVRMARSPALWVHRVASRVTAYLHGACVGAGVEVAAFAGRVVADPAATFRLPEVGMGLIPGAGGTAGIPMRIGPARTAWLALTGETIDAATARVWGLVDEVAPVGHGAGG